MSDSELEALGMSFPLATTEIATAGETSDTITAYTNIDGAKMSTTAVQVNFFHDVMDFSSVEGEKLY